jgi:hypothetical protein
MAHEAAGNDAIGKMRLNEKNGPPERAYFFAALSLYRRVHLQLTRAIAHPAAVLVRTR